MGWVIFLFIALIIFWFIKNSDKGKKKQSPKYSIETNYYIGGRKILQKDIPIPEDNEDWKKSYQGGWIVSFLKKQKITFSENISYKEAKKLAIACKALMKVWEDFNKSYEISNELKNEFVNLIVVNKKLINSLPEYNMVRKDSKGYQIIKELILKRTEKT